jgi:hypothetical protein
MADENTNYRILITGVGFLGRILSLALKDKHPQWNIDALDILPPDEHLGHKIGTFIHGPERASRLLSLAITQILSYTQLA